MKLPIKIPLSGINGKGKFALVDRAAYPLVKDSKWHLTNYGYASSWIDGKNTSMHRLLTGFNRVDHKNRNRLDNRRVNLREATVLENNRNMSKRKGTLYTGVIVRTNSHYETYYQVSISNVHYGNYFDLKTAALVVDEVRRAIWAGYTFVENFPNERLPEGFQIVNLTATAKAGMPSAEFRSGVKGVVWDKQSARWVAKYRGKCKTSKILEDAINGLAELKETLAVVL